MAHEMSGEVSESKSACKEREQEVSRGNNTHFVLHLPYLPVPRKLEDPKLTQTAST